MMFSMVIVNTKVVENFINFPEYLIAWLLDLYNSSYDPNIKLLFQSRNRHMLVVVVYSMCC